MQVFLQFAGGGLGTNVPARHRLWRRP